MESSSKSRPSHRSILIIEDEEFIRLTVADHLKDNGHSADEAASGAEGLRLLDVDRHETVLLDLRLGDMDGHSILAGIREKSAEIPVIIVSGAGDMHDVIKALRAGASDFLTKPILDFALLDLALEKAWERLDLLQERREYAHELERRVLERTAELAETNSKLQESEALFRQLVENINEIFWLQQLDPPRMLYFSKACEGILGVSRDVVMDDIRNLVKHIHPDDYARARDFFQLKTLENPVDEYFKFIRPDGEIRWLRSKIFPIASAHGISPRVAGITEDITERIAAAERDKDNQRKLIQADKLISLGTLAAGVAHEINNPNHLLRLNAQAVEQIWSQLREQFDVSLPEASAISIGGMTMEQLDTEIPRLLRGMIGASDRIRDIVQHMKDFARTDTQDTDQPVNVEDVLRAAVSLLHNKLKNATDRLEISIESGVPPVKGSHQRLEQVFINLLMNAAEALQDKNAGIHVCLRRQSPHQLELTIRDEGTGITAQVLEHIFDPFFTTKRDCGGLGLGLSISKTIIDAHGGELSFEPAQNGGTLARVTLPIMETRS
ncbi:ATP-binding protein [Desulfomicrobium baculatum]|uniref:histidine kinase n=1 Tax=Desulfomicrobium baculatum (strain DSM 4028 / VKM B-1378 / X) TaxID=525897 RepID=C7LSX0_DESBD|nr:ATP-binding protein [Desulfomicrobium baculatum]ACU90720.1 multi-sensor signal transduction histidine kinase [Desulfomicrobium baculatum DSM 4028]